MDPFELNLELDRNLPKTYTIDNLDFILSIFEEEF